MKSSLLDLYMVPHYLVKIEKPKMHLNTSSPFSATIKRLQHIFVCKSSKINVFSCCFHC